MSFLSGLKSFFEKVGAEIEKLFGKAATVEQQIQAVVTYVAPVISTIIGLVDPAVAPAVQKIISIIEADLATLSSVVQGESIAPGSTGLQIVTTTLNNIKSNMAGLLQLAEVKNSSKVTQIETVANGVINEVEAVLGGLPKA